jgi:hypothetical protein
VNDKGEDNDNDKYHVAYSWVVVKLRDINDNKPVFEKSNIEAFVSENARVGKTLERFRASDPDQVSTFSNFSSSSTTVGKNKLECFVPRIFFLEPML